ncbi:MAG TPA: DUF6266 family protein [Puia sp.]|nr:DUF6266 family protein [Puia sp.]
MGRFSKGLYGAFRGKVGSMVGSTWKGIEVVKSKPAGGRKNFSPDQLQQQARFRLMIQFLKPLSKSLNQIYGPTVTQMTGANKSLSYNVKNGISGAYPDFTVNYPKIQLGYGDLPNVDIAQAASTAAGKLTITWTDNSDGGYTQATDNAFVGVYCEEIKRWIFNSSAATRGAGSATIDVTAFSGKTVQTWLGFATPKRTAASVTLFTGQVNIL